jgi:hypothetical protein
MIPSGQKLFLLDGEDVVPILEIRELVFCEAVEEQPATVATSMD